MYDLNSEKDKIKFGENLRKARKDKEYTQDELAELIDVERGTISAWELGRNIPEYGTLYKICDVLKIDIGYLMGDYSEKNYTVHHIKEITNLSENAIEKLLQIACTPYFPQVISTLIENNNCEYYLALLRSRFSSSAYTANRPQDEFLDVQILGENAHIKSDGLLDSLFSTHIVQDMDRLSNEYLALLERNRQETMQQQKIKKSTPKKKRSQK